MRSGGRMGRSRRKWDGWKTEGGRGKERRQGERKRSGTNEREMWN